MTQTREYRLLPHRVSAAQTQMDSLVPALWDRMFPGLQSGPNHQLERVFGGMRLHPERSARSVCPYYFDQVTWRLPAPTSQRQGNLELHFFDSWTDLQRETQRSGGRHPGTTPNAGVYLTRLCRLRDLETGGSVTTRTFIRLMYDYGG